MEADKTVLPISVQSIPRLNAAEHVFRISFKSRTKYVGSTGTKLKHIPSHLALTERERYSRYDLGGSTGICGYCGLPGGRVVEKVLAGEGARIPPDLTRSRGPAPAGGYILSKSSLPGYLLR